MTPHPDSQAYSPKLWSQAPEGATHWGVYDGFSMGRVKHGDGVFLEFATVPVGDSIEDCYSIWTGKEWSAMVFDADQFTDLHERPAAYRTPEQLIAEYRKEHGAEIEDAIGDPSSLDLSTILHYSGFYLMLLERHLAAERARIEADAGGGS